MLTYNFAALLYQVCTVASATQAAPKGGEPPFAAVCTKVSYARRFQLVDATVNGGVRTCHWGGAKVDHFGARALERVALI